MGKPQVNGFDGDDTHSAREYVVATNTGMRRWYIMDTSRPLRSMSFPYYWNGRGPHVSQMGSYNLKDAWEPDYPRVGNSVGFYAYYKRDQYIGYADGAKWRIGGVVEGYGRTVVGTKGFRSERAVILGFSLGDLANLADEQFGLSSYHTTPSEKETITEYLERYYPTVPVFKTTEEMLALIPLSTKPFFTRYDDGNEGV